MDILALKDRFWFNIETTRRNLIIPHSLILSVSYFKQSFRINPLYQSIHSLFQFEENEVYAPNLFLLLAKFFPSHISLDVALFNNRYETHLKNCHKCQASLARLERKLSFFKDTVQPLALAIGAAVLTSWLITTPPNTWLETSTTLVQMVLSVVQNIAAAGWGLVVWTMVSKYVDLLEKQRKSYFEGDFEFPRNKQPTDIVGEKMH